MTGPFRVFSGPVGSVHVATLALTVGTGAWYTAWTIYFTRTVGLSMVEFGVGVTVAGAIGLVLGGPVGYLADRAGIRETVVVAGVLQGVSVLGYLLVQNIWTFVAVACVAVTTQRVLPAMRMALIAALTEGPDRLTAMSNNRVVSHIGMGAGAGIGTLILYLDTRAAFAALILLYTTAALLSSALVLRAPHVASLQDRKVKRRVLVAGDRPFLIITVLVGVLALNWGMLGIGVPLWVIMHTHGPTWIVGVIMVLNAVAIVLFQNRSSRIGRTVPGAARAALYSGLALAASCLIFAASYHGAGLPVIIVLLVAAGVHVVGEIYFSTASWGLSVGLTPQDAHGEYQAMFAAGYSVAELAAPVVMTALVANWGVGGWFALAGLFLVCVVPIGPISRWAVRTNHRTTPAHA